MGKLNYGHNFTVEMDDASLVHLDAILKRVRDDHFQLHILDLGMDRDGSMACLSIGSGAPLWLEFYNGPEIFIDMDAINFGVFKIQTTGSLSLPFSFSKRDVSEVGND